MRMKRFSSALCLADQAKQPTEQQQQQQRRKQQVSCAFEGGVAGRAPRESRTTSNAQHAKHATLLQPEDPIYLARQRRPSASNQGTLNVDQQALFSAVECNQLERAKTILEDGKVNVNSLNGDKLTCLDIAALLRNSEMVRLLQQHNAKESSAYLSREGRANQLYALYTEAKRLVEDLSRSLEAVAPLQAGGLEAAASDNPAHSTSGGGPLMLATGSLLSSALLEEKQRQLQYWRRRLDLFMHMRYQFERLQVPGAPELVVLQVVGEEALGVKIVHSLRPSAAAAAGVAHCACAAAGAASEEPALRLTSETLRRCKEARCSHWLLTELATDRATPKQRRETKRAAARRKLNGARQNGDSPPSANRRRRERLIKEQRLLVFDQMIAQQLIALSHQQAAARASSARAASVLPKEAGGIGGPLAATSNAAEIGACAMPAQAQRQRLQVAHNNSLPDSSEQRAEGVAATPISSGRHALTSHHQQQQQRHLPEPSLAYKLITGATRSGALDEQPQLAGQLKQAAAAAAIAASQEPAQAGAYLKVPLCEAAACVEPEASQEVIVTKYKLEWSLDELMAPLAGSMIVYNTSACPLECRIGQLRAGQRYFVRVSAGNHRGFSKPQPATPACLSPSSWRQVEGNKRRKYDEQVFRKFTQLILLNKHILDDHQTALMSAGSGATSQQQQVAALGGPTNASKSSLINMLLLDAALPQAEQLRQERHLAAGAALYAANNNQQAEQQQQQLLQQQLQQQQQQQQSSSSVRKNLKNFFQSNSFKFHKLNNQHKRGLYLATLIYQDSEEQVSGHRLVVTNDDRLPIVEVANELVAPGALMSDFYWLLKINGTQWLDIRRLRQQLQKSHSSSTLHLRIKLLLAVEQMQLALNTEDIGRLFYKPIQAHDGSTLIATAKRVPDTKLVANLSLKWTHQLKIMPRHLRKISDSMLQRQADAVSFFPTPDSGNQRVGVSSAERLDVSNQGEQQLKLCESCQWALVQRRSTMASGSSSSSLASSAESQWSAPGGALASRCVCARLNLRPNELLGGNQQLLAASSFLNASSCTIAAAGLQTQAASSVTAVCAPLARHSTSAASSSTTRSASTAGCAASAMATPTHLYNAAAQRPSAPQQQQQQLAAPHKSSTYLMLASLSLYDLLLFTLNEIIHFHRSSTLPLKRGLYLGFVQLQTTVESMRLLVPRSRPNMVPCARIRDNAHVSKEEWLLLKRFAQLGCAPHQTVNQQPATPSARPSGRGQPPVGNLSQAQRASSQSGSGSLWSMEEQQQSQARAACDQPGGVTRALQAEGRVRAESPQGETARAKSVSPALIRGADDDDEEDEDDVELGDGELVAHKQVGGVRRLASSHSSEQLASTKDERRTSNASNLSEGLQAQSRQLDAAAAAAAAVDESTDAGCPLTRPRRVSAGGGGRRQSALGSKSPTSTSRLTVNSSASCLLESPEETFVRLVGGAAARLLGELSLRLPRNQESNESILAALNERENNRIYNVELIELSNQVSFVLLLPAAENVCPVTSQEKSNILADNAHFMLLPLQIFETIHIGTYEPELLGKYSRLSAILETDLIVAQHEQRQAFSSSELKSAKTRVSSLQDMVGIADEFWRQLRWIVDVVSFARDKSSGAQLSGVRLGAIWRYFELSPSASFDHSINWLTGNWPKSTKERAASFARSAAAKVNVVCADGASQRRSELPDIQLNAVRAPHSQAPEEPAASVKPVAQPAAQAIEPAESKRENLSLVGQKPAATTWGALIELAPIEAPSSEEQRDAHQAGAQVRVQCTIFADRQVAVSEIRADEDEDEEEHDDDDDDGKQRGAGAQLKAAELRIGASKQATNFATSNNELAEEEAIYAYHISLREAAAQNAAHRKSSQQSIKAFVEEPLLSESGSLVAPKLAAAAAAAPKTQQERLTPSRLTATSCSLASAESAPALQEPLGAGANTNIAGQARPESQPSGNRRRRTHFKATNPFLSDSLDSD